jgi:hypothetical protein
MGTKQREGALGEDARMSPRDSSTYDPSVRKCVPWETINRRKKLTQINLQELTALVWRERDRFRGKVIAFCAVTVFATRPGNQPYGVGIAVLGEPGYSLTSVPMLHNSFESASDMADTLNTILGLHPDTAVVIIAETMSRQRFKNRQKEVADGWYFYEVKMSFHQMGGEPLEPDEDGIIALIEEAVGDIAYGDDENGNLIASIEVRAS